MNPANVVALEKTGFLSPRLLEAARGCWRLLEAARQVLLPLRVILPQSLSKQRHLLHFVSRNAPVYDFYACLQGTWRERAKAEGIFAAFKVRRGGESQTREMHLALNLSTDF